ncbi:MAG TPA: chemotaxis-specific protein-glutamate methyltransferase CheB [Polyangiaceae bacterium]
MKLRVLVVEDSLTVRQRLVEVLRSDPELEVVGEASDGRSAIELCQRLRPDVVTLDMMLPVMTGLAATEYIMAHFPTPILVVSASFNRGELFKTYDALAAGAVDVIEKPTGLEPPGTWERAFLSTLKIVARVRVITHPRARLTGLSRFPAAAATELVPASGRHAGLVAIGASTGGPTAIVEVLRHLTPAFPLPILIVLHLGAPFAAPFADWLGAQTGLAVAYATEGEPLARVTGVRLAPPERHLVLRDGALRLTHTPERHSCRPAVDELFESAARECGAKVVGCLLTGMGRDGAQGLLGLRRTGALTIAQDEASSVVYGMPREAALLGAAERVLPLSEIGPLLAALPGAGARA